jgi:hypothetical protein
MPETVYAPPAPLPGARPSAVTTVAVVNIVMALLCGFSSLSTILQPALVRVQQASMRRAQETTNAQFRQQIEQLRRQRAQTTDPAQRRQIDATIKQVEAMKMPDMSRLAGAFAVPTWYCFWAGGAGLVINCLLLISGIGLLSMARWARLLAIAAAAGWIVYSLATTAAALFLIAPRMGRGFRMVMSEVLSQIPPGQPAPPIPDLGGVMEGVVGVSSIGTLIISCAWPVAAIVLLTGRSVREAFRDGLNRQDAKNANSGEGTG